MNFDLSAEEMDVLKDELWQAIKKVENEKSRTDNIDYHKLLTHRADVLEELYKKLVGEPAPIH